MNKWKKIRLSDITEVITKGTTPTTIGYSFVDRGVNFVKIESLTNQGTFLLDKMEHIIEECNEKMKRSQLKENDILFSIAGAIGRTAIVTKEILPANTNQALAIIRLKINEKIVPEFLLKSLKSEYINKQFQRKKQGVAQLNLSLKDIGDLEIIYPYINEQIKIVKVLDKAQELIDKRKEQIQALDELVKSQFIEMFGDPVKNPLGWELKPFLESGNCKNGMNFSATETGIELQYLGVGDFKDLSKIEDTNNLGKVSLNKMPSKEYILQDGDIVFVRSNGNKALVGRCLAVYPNGVATTYSGFCIRYRKKDENLEIPYLLQVLKTDSMRKNMAGRGANIQNLNQQILGALMIPVPPLELQKQFKDFIEQVEKLKFEMEESLKELEDNFNSLMQKAFKGELF